MARAGKRIAVIGGGFSGAAFALQLARKTQGPLSIDIVEPRERLGGGVAYSATDPAHRINVPASKMIVFAEDPTHFDRWLRRGDALAEDPAALRPDGHAYPQRAVFGRYLAELVAATARDRPGVEIRHLRERAVAVAGRDYGYGVTLESGRVIEADLVVLATSHPPPAPPGGAIRALGEDGAIIADPWRPGALDGIGSKDDVLIIGTALTMADTVASLDRLGHRGRIVAFSRRGLLSRGHAAQVFDPFDRLRTVAPPETALGLLRLVRRAVADAERDGLPWQAVLDDVRANALPLWSALPLEEKRVLLRHLRSFWDVHRYRIAPQVEDVIVRKRAEGSLEVLAASLAEAKRVEKRIEVALHPRATAAGKRIRRTVDAIIVTTGPAHGSVIETNAALASLERQGMLRADRLGLGIEVDRSSRVLDAEGRAQDTLYVAGPLARGTFGELMGLPQVSQHAESVAGHVARWLDG